MAAAKGNCCNRSGKAREAARPQEKLDSGTATAKLTIAVSKRQFVNTRNYINPPFALFTPQSKAERLNNYEES
jgi:hypothetical protein